MNILGKIYTNHKFKYSYIYKYITKKTHTNQKGKHILYALARSTCLPRLQGMLRHIAPSEWRRPAFRHRRSACHTPNIF